MALQRRPFRLAQAIRMLPQRTKEGLHFLHYLQDGGGIQCLDLNVSASSVDELHQRVEEALRSLEPDSVLPAAPKASWDRLPLARMIGSGALPYRYKPNPILYVLLAID